MKIIGVFLVFATIGLYGCAQVPRESVELSTTIGRDLATIHESHRKLAELLFNRMRQDVNRFVDNVYAPYQIRAMMEDEMKRAVSPLEDDRRTSLLLAMNNAFKPGADAALRHQVLDATAYFFSAIHEDVEDKRSELLEPLARQEREALDAIDRSYAQVIAANSTVTTHLASVIKVHDEQGAIAKAAGLDPNLSREISGRLSDASDRVSMLVEKAEGADATVGSIAAAITDLKKVFTEK